MWELLQTIEEALKTISDLKTVSIGAESGISSKDAPAARIVTEYSEPSSKNKYFDHGVIQVILLMDLKNDLPSVYENSIALELQIRSALKNIVLFNRIDYDQDGVTVFKASILRFTFSGIRNGKTECNL